MKIMEKPIKVFLWFFFEFEGSGIAKIGRKCDKIEPGVFWNATEFSGGDGIG